MRFITGLVAAGLMVLALMLFIPPGPTGPPSDGPRVPIKHAAPAVLEQVGAVGLEPSAGWRKVESSELSKLKDLATFTEFAKRARGSLSLLKQSADGEFDGLLMLLDMGRSSVNPAAIIRKVADKHQNLSSGSRVLWNPRKEKIGEVDSVSFAIKFPVRGQIGKRNMRGSYYAAKPGGRGMLVIAIGIMGAQSDRQLDRMLATLREI